MEKSCKELQTGKSNKITGETQTVLKIMENNVLKLYGHVECMQDNRWPERIMMWSPEEDDDDGDLK